LRRGVGKRADAQGASISPPIRSVPFDSSLDATPAHVELAERQRIVDADERAVSAASRAPACTGRRLSLAEVARSAAMFEVRCRLQSGRAAGAMEQRRAHLQFLHLAATVPRRNDFAALTKLPLHHLDEDQVSLRSCDMPSGSNGRLAQCAIIP
jgi:hypothetical protein